ncbi:hypothetical protein BC827DRAFT_1385662 [Russula dissimulans]|nr:hypothetical protein BC827DRAFT_1385662 [Russula dissimulans]
MALVTSINTFTDTSSPSSTTRARHEICAERRCFGGLPNDDCQLQQWLSIFSTSRTTSSISTVVSAGGKVPLGLEEAREVSPGRSSDPDRISGPRRTSSSDRRRIRSSMSDDNHSDSRSDTEVISHAYKASSNLIKPSAVSRARTESPRPHILPEGQDQRNLSEDDEWLWYDDDPTLKVKHRLERPQQQSLAEVTPTPGSLGGRSNSRMIDSSVRDNERVGAKSLTREQSQSTQDTRGRESTRTEDSSIIKYLANWSDEGAAAQFPSLGQRRLEWDARIEWSNLVDKLLLSWPSWSAVVHSTAGSLSDIVALIEGFSNLCCLRWAGREKHSSAVPIAVPRKPEVICERKKAEAEQ